MEQGVGQDVAEDESVLGAPVAPSQKKVTCATCGSGFPKQSNLTRHVEAKHTDQTTPAAVARRKELKEYRKANSRERRANDRVYREKMQQVSATNRAKKKARLAIAAGGACALPDAAVAPAEKEESKEVAVEEVPKDDAAAPAEEAKADEAAQNDTPKRLTHGPCPGLGKAKRSREKAVINEPSSDAPEPDNRREGGGRVKKSRKKDKTKGVPLRVETTALTTAKALIGRHQGVFWYWSLALIRRDQGVSWR
jgi:hypothetical protein